MHLQGLRSPFRNGGGLASTWFREKVQGSNRMRDSLQLALAQAARELPAEELPEFIGELESVKAAAYARLMSVGPAPQEHDELLSVEVASARLGISRDYLYRHHSQYAFTRRQGRKLLFSAFGIEKHIREKRA